MDWSHIHSPAVSQESLCLSRAVKWTDECVDGFYVFQLHPREELFEVQDMQRAEIHPAKWRIKQECRSLSLSRLCSATGKTRTNSRPHCPMKVVKNGSDCAADHQPRDVKSSDCGKQNTAARFAAADV